MRILHVNKFLYRRGGAESYMLDLAAAQAGRGHDIAFFGMAHPENPPMQYERHFPDHLDFDPPPRSLTGKVRGAGRLLYSTSARRGIARVLDEFAPDLVHLHNIYHQLSPSILQPIRKAGVPAVMTLHDYKLACPTYLFLDKGQVCEACLGGHFFQAVRRRCNDGSLAASSLNAFELALHTATKAYAPIASFACPSRFVATKMAQAGVFPDRLRHVPNFVHVDEMKTKDREGGGVLYAGRLAVEKGVDTLITSAASIGAPLDIAGTGPAAAMYEAQARSLGGSIRFHGRLEPRDLRRLIRTAAVVAIPSRCHENQPLIALEAMACGVPVVATSLGGLPELVRPGIDGDLVPPNDPPALAASLERFLGDPRGSYEMGRAGRAKIEREFSLGRHLERVDALYDEAAQTNRRSKDGTGS